MIIIAPFRKAAELPYKLVQNHSGVSASRMRVRWSWMTRHGDIGTANSCLYLCPRGKDRKQSKLKQSSIWVSHTPKNLPFTSGMTWRTASCNLTENQVLHLWHGRLPQVLPMLLRLSIKSAWGLQSQGEPHCFRHCHRHFWPKWGSQNHFLVYGLDLEPWQINNNWEQSTLWKTLLQNCLILKLPTMRKGKGKLKMTQNYYTEPRYNENIKLWQRDF